VVSAERRRVQFLDHSNGADDNDDVIGHCGKRRLVIIPAFSFMKPSASPVR
jgi:hypothetical protein